MQPIDANEQIYKARSSIHSLKYLLLDNHDGLHPDTCWGLAVILESIEERLTLALQEVGGNPDATRGRRRPSRIDCPKHTTGGGPCYCYSPTT